MSHSSSLDMPKTLTVLQKGARAMAFKSLNLMQIGCLTIKESFNEVGIEQFGPAQEGRSTRR